jgi:Fic-DOC domain mobile mystery protein B
VSPVGPRDDDAATPLDPDEREGLRLSHIATRDELNAAEQANIVDGQQWALGRRRDVLDERFLRELHRRMLGQVWRWAGQYRQTAKNIGVDSWRIGEELARLIADCRYWIAHDTYPGDEIAARFHHRLTWIHCFANGNGRHARIATDLLLAQLGRPAFSWGRANLANVSAARTRYVEALRAADRHDFAPLTEFVRS